MMVLIFPSCFYFFGRITPLGALFMVSQKIKSKFPPQEEISLILPGP